MSLSGWQLCWQTLCYHQWKPTLIKSQLCLFPVLWLPLVFTFLITVFNEIIGKPIKCKRMSITFLKLNYLKVVTSNSFEEDDRGWDGWMVSATQWTWVWINSGSWWWTGRPDVLQSMGSELDMTEWLNWTVTSNSDTRRYYVSERSISSVCSSYKSITAV